MILTLESNSPAVIVQYMPRSSRPSRIPKEWPTFLQEIVTFARHSKCGSLLFPRLLGRIRAWQLGLWGAAHHQGLWRPQLLSPTWLNHFHFPSSAPLTCCPLRVAAILLVDILGGSRSSSGLHYCQTQRRLMRGLDPFLNVAGAIPWTSEYAISGEVHSTGA